jgi:hypothetical protein
MSRPPRVRWTFHGTAAVRSYQATLDWLGRFVGCVALEVSDAPPPIARYGGCCWLGDSQIELAQPNAADTPTARFIERFGPGYLNLALQLDDLGIADAWFSAHGAKPTLPPDNGFTFTRPSETCGLQFEWADFSDQHWDPRQGGQIPLRPPALIDAPRIAHWGALVQDPAAAVARLAELWPAPLLFLREDAPLHEPAAALSLADGVLTLYRLPADSAEEARLWGRSAGRPRFHLMTFRVRDLAAAEKVFAREQVRILRGSAASGEIITHPDDCTGLPIAWTDRDLPGDPRGPLGS